MRLYKGMKKQLYKRYRRELGGFNTAPEIKVGDLLHDCDGFNHIVTRIEYLRHKVDRPLIREKQRGGGKQTHFVEVGRGVKIRQKRWYLYDADYYREDGDCFCTCSNFPTKPHTPEEITNYIAGWNCLEGLRMIEEWDMQKIKAAIERLQQGLPACDERGLPL